MDPKLILGMTCSSGNCITGHADTGLIAYAASNSAVLFNTLLTKQIGYLQGSRQLISCLSFSADASHILIGHVGHKPPVHVWNVSKKVKVASLRGHDCGVQCVSFSPKSDLIVSIGEKFDGFVFVWAWPQQFKIACNRFSDEIKSLSYDPSSRYFVTCGVHHIKFWYPEAVFEEANADKGNAFKASVLMKDMLTLYGRPALLEHVKTATFISVACGCKSSADLVFAVAIGGLICRLSANRTVQHVEFLEVTQLSSVSVYDDLLIAGSTCGNIFFFDSITMKFKCSLSFPVDMYFMKQAQRSCKNWTGLRRHRDMYLFYDGMHKILTAISLEGSLCLWDVTDLKKHKVKSRYFTNSHERSISGSQVFQVEDCEGKKKECLVTVSHDATIRLWDLKIGENVGCKYVRTIYTDFNDPSMENRYAGKNIITATAVNGSLVAAGNSNGWILVFSTATLEKVESDIHGHDRGITCLNFHTSPTGVNQHLMSGSRDRLINIYDTNNGFCLLKTLKFHSGSLTGITTLSLQTHTVLVSTALDRSLVISQNRTENSPSFSVRYNRFLSSSVVSSAFCEADDSQQLYVVAGTRIGEIHVMKTQSCTIERVFRASNDPRAHLETLSLQQKSNIILAACSDRSINILDFQEGSLLKSIVGHGSGLSGIYFFKNSNYFVTTSRDGCAIIWDLPTSITEQSKSQADTQRRSGVEINVLTRETLLRHTDSFLENPGVTSGKVVIMPGSKVLGPMVASDSALSLGHESSLLVSEETSATEEHFASPAASPASSPTAIKVCKDEQNTATKYASGLKGASGVIPSMTPVPAESALTVHTDELPAVGEAKEPMGDVKASASEGLHSNRGAWLELVRCKTQKGVRKAYKKRINSQEEVKGISSEETIVLYSHMSNKRRRSSAAFPKKTVSAKNCHE